MGSCIEKYGFLCWFLLRLLLVAGGCSFLDVSTSVVFPNLVGWFFAGCLQIYVHTLQQMFMSDLSEYAWCQSIPDVRCCQTYAPGEMSECQMCEYASDWLTCQTMCQGQLQNMCQTLRQKKFWVIMFFKLFLLRWRWHKVKYMWYMFHSSPQAGALNSPHSPRKQKNRTPKMGFEHDLSVEHLQRMATLEVHVTAFSTTHSWKNWRWLKKMKLNCLASASGCS